MCLKKKKNPVLVITSEKGTLLTDYRRNRYFREHFSIIEPTELLCNRTSKQAFVSISANQVVEHLWNTAEFLEKVVFSEESPPGFYKTFQDGDYFKQYELFGEQELFIALGVQYILCNPIRHIRENS